MATATQPIVGRYVKKQGSDRIIPVDHAGILLARVGIDMFECDKNGNPIDSSPTGRARAAKIEGSPDQKEVRIPRVAETSRVKMAPEPPKTEKQLEADEARKIKLIQYAQDRHNVVLDPADSLGLIEARVTRLNEKAGIPVSEGPGKKTAARKVRKA